MNSIRPCKGAFKNIDTYGHVVFKSDSMILITILYIQEVFPICLTQTRYIKRDKIRQERCTYYMAKKSWRILWSNLLYKIGQEFLDNQYNFFRHLLIAGPSPCNKCRRNPVRSRIYEQPGHSSNKVGILIEREDLGWTRAVSMTRSVPLTRRIRISTIDITWRNLAVSMTWSVLLTYRIGISIMVRARIWSQLDAMALSKSLY